MRESGQWKKKQKEKKPMTQGAHAVAINVLYAPGQRRPQVTVKNNRRLRKRMA